MIYRTPADFDNSGYIGTRYETGAMVVYDSHRSYRRYLGTADEEDPGYNNPLFTVNVQENPYVSDHIVGGLNLDYDLTEKIKFIFKSGIDYASSKSASYFPVFSGEAKYGSYSTGVSAYTIFTNDLITQYSNNLTTDLSLDILLGVNLEATKSEYGGGGYSNFLLNTSIPTSSNATVENKYPGFGTSYKRKMAGYTSSTLTYKEMLFATVQAG